MGKLTGHSSSYSERDEKHGKRDMIGLTGFIIFFMEYLNIQK